MAWRRWVIVPVVLFLLSACSAQSADTGGETNWLHCERDDDCEGSASCVEGLCSSPDSGTGGGSTDAGVANAGAASGGAANAGAANGGAANGGSTSGELSCDGEAIGAWRGVLPGLPEQLSDPEHDGCWNIMFYDNEGSLGVTSLLSQVSPDLERTLTLRIDTDGTQDQIPGLNSNVYQVIQELKGPITQHFGPECMTFAGRQVACEELSDPLTQSGIGEGVWRSVVCSPANEGGCDCLLDYAGLTSEQGTWQTMENQIVLTRFGYYPEGLGEEATSAPIDYCASEDTLRFGAAMNDWWDGLAGVPLTPVDCANAMPLPGGGGVDCIACPNACSQSGASP
jgi:hypothetical protein